MLVSVDRMINDTPEYSDVNVGARIRELRTQHQLSLRELGGRLGISASALSQIETGKRRPSVPRLHQIINVLDAPLSAIFGERSPADATRIPAPHHGRGDEGVSIQRAADAFELTLEGGVHWLRLPPTPIPGIDLLKVTYPPGVGSSEYLRHNGYETAHVLTGSLTFDVGFDHYTVEAGDSISYKSTSPHRIRNVGTEVAEAIWLVQNVLFDHGQEPEQLDS